MPHRFYCYRCKQSVYNCFIEGQRVPLVAYIVVQQPDDTGPQFDAVAEGVKLPSAVRAIIGMPIPRVELCVKCFAELFSLPNVAAADDPVVEATMKGPTPAELSAMQHVDRCNALAIPFVNTLLPTTAQEPTITDAAATAADQSSPS